ncbi:hypothetical protein J4Q44_G00392200, partial [Coregonus suidteri]
VGKTAIVSQFLNGRFDEQYTPTIEDFHRKLYSIKGDAYQLDILDTSGNHRFPAMRRLSILTGDVFILVFSLDNRDSFQEVQRLKRQIIETKSCLKNKTKENVDVPLTLFTMAKLPNEMSPDLHRKVSVQYCDMLRSKSLKK